MNYCTVEILFSPLIQDIMREPESSIVSAIAKIGGLFALLRLSIFLNLWHQSLFESKMKATEKRKS